MRTVTVLVLFVGLVKMRNFLIETDDATEVGSDYQDYQDYTDYNTGQNTELRSVKLRLVSTSLEPPTGATYSASCGWSWKLW